jgi:hypothetical protein
MRPFTQSLRNEQAAYPVTVAAVLFSLAKLINAWFVFSCFRRGSGTPTAPPNGARSTGRIHSNPHSKTPSIAACVNACGNLIAVALR